MPIFHCSYFSTTLQTETKLVITLPGPFLFSEDDVSLENQFNPKRTYPVVYLLHGATDNEEGWLRYTSVERYARERGVALVLPYVENSFYVDMHCGPRYWRFISHELPLFIRATFPAITTKREETYVAGLSMGGYGALLLALRQPERFCAAASLSGALDPYQLFKEGIIPNLDHKTIYGNLDNVPGSDMDLLALLQKNIDEDRPLPRLFQACGTEDFLYSMNRNFLESATKMGVPITYEESPGMHSWDFWDRMIVRALDWFDIPQLDWNEAL